MSAASPVIQKVFQRDWDATAQILQEWFERNIDAGDVTLDSLGPTRGAGLSHELLSADVSWQAGKGRESQGFILRLDPVNYRKRHTSNLRREFEVQAILGKLGTSPVAKVFWYEDDASVMGAEFYAMARLDGRTFPESPAWQAEGWVVELSPGDQKTLWRNFVSTMATAHRTPVDKLAALRRDGPGADDFERQLLHWRASYEWATARSRSAKVEAAWKWLFDNKPANPPPGLAWGDAHPRNMMFDGLEVMAILDWEDVALGSPVCDLGRWFLTDRLQAYWNRHNPPGVLTNDEIIAQWEAETGYSAADVRWFQVLNGCFAAGTLARTAQLQEEILGEATSVDAKGAATVEQVLSDLISGA